jgi:hypothetical protein
MRSGGYIFEHSISRVTEQVDIVQGVVEIDMSTPSLEQ